MKLALIVPNTFDNLDLLVDKIKKLNPTEIISGSSHGIELLSRAEQKFGLVINFKKALGEKTKSAYNAMEEADEILFFHNGEEGKSKSRSSAALNKAITEYKSKKRYVFSDKAKALEISVSDLEYACIDLNNQLLKSSGVNGVYLNREELEKLIDSLQNVLFKLNSQHDR